MRDRLRYTFSTTIDDNHAEKLSGSGSLGDLSSRSSLANQRKFQISNWADYDDFVGSCLWLGVHSRTENTEKNHTLGRLWDIVALAEPVAPLVKGNLLGE